MRRTGFLYDERFLLHLTGPEHPEAPERLPAIYRGVEEGALLPQLTQIKARPCEAGVDRGRAQHETHYAV